MTRLSWLVAAVFLVAGVAVALLWPSQGEKPSTVDVRTPSEVDSAPLRAHAVSLEWVGSDQRNLIVRAYRTWPQAYEVTLVNAFIEPEHRLHEQSSSALFEQLDEMNACDDVRYFEEGAGPPPTSTRAGHERLLLTIACTDGTIRLLNLLDDQERYGFKSASLRQLQDLMSGTAAAAASDYEDSFDEAQGGGDR